MNRGMRNVAFVVAIQIAIVSLLVGRALSIRTGGTEITLETEPIDPFDPFAGYYVTLAYGVERPDSMFTDVNPGTPVWITVEPGYPAWQRIALTQERPAGESDHVAILALWNGSRARIDGAGRFYISEAEVDTVAHGMTKVGGHALVDMKVDPDGNVSLLRLRIGDQTFEN